MKLVQTIWTYIRREVLKQVEAYGLKRLPAKAQKESNLKALS